MGSMVSSLIFIVMLLIVFGLGVALVIAIIRYLNRKS